MNNLIAKPPSIYIALTWFGPAQSFCSLYFPSPFLSIQRRVRWVLPTRPFAQTSLRTIHISLGVRYSSFFLFRIGPGRWKLGANRVRVRAAELRDPLNTHKPQIWSRRELAHYKSQVLLVSRFIRRPNFHLERGSQRDKILFWRELVLDF